MRVRTGLMSILVIASVLLLLSLAFGETALPELFKRVSPAVGALYAQSESGSLSFNCTVTAVEKTATQTIVLTANHCVTKGVSYLVTFDGRQFYAARVWKLPKEQVNKNHQRPFNEPETDMAFFVIDFPLAIPVIPLGTSQNLEPGRRVVTVGFPLGITKVRYDGLVAGIFERQGADQHGYIILQIFGAPGSSGSAVIDQETGTIIGVLVSARQASVGLPVVFATPIDYAANLTPATPEAKSKNAQSSEVLP